MEGTQVASSEVATAQPNMPLKYKINVNGREYDYETKDTTIDYKGLIYLAYSKYEPNRVYTVTVCYPNNVDKKSKSLVAGESVELMDGLIFNIANT